MAGGLMEAIFIDSDFDEDITITNDQDVAQDITDWTFECLFKQGCNELTLKVGSGITILDAENGLFRISLSASQTSQLSIGQVRVMLWRTDSGMRKIIGEGSASVEGKSFDA
jgi:hypothetical protein